MRLERALYALHDCSSIRQVQSTFLRYIPDLIPARAYGIYHLDHETKAPLRVQTRGASDAFLTDYEERGRATDPLFARAVTEHDAFCSDLHFSLREWRSLPFYEIVAGGGLQREMQAPVIVAGKVVGTINAGSSFRDRPFTAPKLEFLRVLARHVSLAYARVLRDTEVAQRQFLVNAALDQLSVPLLVTDGSGGVLVKNRAADRFLDAGQEFIDVFEGALSDNTEQLASGERRVATTIAPLERSLGETLARETATGLSVRSARIRGSSAVVSFVYETTTPTVAPLPILSRREREIVALLVQGLTNKQIAAAASISPNTVKQHLKRVFRKLHVNSRAELAVAVSRSQEPFVSS